MGRVVGGWMDRWLGGRAGQTEKAKGKEEGRSAAGAASSRRLKSFGREARKCIRAQFSLGGESNQELAATLESFR